MRSIINYLKEIIFGVWSLLKGMKVTGSYFFRPSTIITQKYPNNRKNLVYLLLIQKRTTRTDHSINREVPRYGLILTPTNML